MTNKINEVLKLNEVKLQDLNKTAKQLLERIKNSAIENAEKNNIFEIINHLPVDIRELEQTYIKMRTIDEENQKLKYFLEG